MAPLLPTPTTSASAQPSQLWAANMQASSRAFFSRCLPQRPSRLSASLAVRCSSNGASSSNGGGEQSRDDDAVFTDLKGKGFGRPKQQQQQQQQPTAASAADALQSTLAGGRVAPLAAGGRRRCLAALLQQHSLQRRGSNMRPAASVRNRSACGFRCHSTVTPPPHTSTHARRPAFPGASLQACRRRRGVFRRATTSSLTPQRTRTSGGSWICRCQAGLGGGERATAGCAAMTGGVLALPPGVAAGICSVLRAAAACSVPLCSRRRSDCRLPCQRGTHVPRGTPV